MTFMSVVSMDTKGRDNIEGVSWCKCDSESSVGTASTMTPSVTGSLSTLNSFDSQTTLCRQNSGVEQGSQPTSSPVLTQEKNYKGVKKYLGLMLALCASLFFSVALLFVKILKDYGLDAYQVSFWRYIGTVVLCQPLLYWFECGPPRKKKGVSVLHGVWPVTKGDNWKALVGLVSRGIVGSTAVILRYYSLHFLTLGDTSVITYSTPIVVLVLAHFLLGEKCAIFPVIIVFTTLCGVVIVMKPPILTGAHEFDTETMIGTALAGGSLLCTSLMVIITRKVRAVHFTVTTLLGDLIGAVEALLLIYFLGEFDIPQEWEEGLYIGGIAALCFLAQLSMVLALKYEDAGPVALIRSCDVLFGFIFQYVFLSVLPDVYSIIGAAIVLLGMFAIAFRKWLGALPDDDKRRNTWRLILK